MKKIIKSYDFELEEEDYSLIRKNAKKLLKLALVDGFEDFDEYYDHCGLTDGVIEILPFLKEVLDIDYEEYDYIMEKVCEIISCETSPEFIILSHSDFSDYDSLKNVIANKYDCVETVMDALSKNEPLFNQVVDYLLGSGTLKNERLDLE